MKITIDTVKKTIELHGEVKISSLAAFCESCNIDPDEYSIVHSKIVSSAHDNLIGKLKNWKYEKEKENPYNNKRDPFDWFPNPSFPPQYLHEIMCAGIGKFDSPKTERHDTALGHKWD